MAKGYRLSDRLRVLPGGAALITPEEVLVVADMHLGCEAVLEDSGLSLPRVQTKHILHNVRALVDEVSPSKLVIAGDLKHNFSRNLAQEWDDVARFVRSLEGSVPLEVVKGNHDNYLGAILRAQGVPFAGEASVSGVRVLHGHEGVLDGRPTVMGHIHPSVALGDSTGARVKDGCFLFHEERQVLVLPAQSIVAGGVDVVTETDLGLMSPLLSEVDVASFAPVAFSDGTPLRFPALRRLRNEERV